MNTDTETRLTAALDAWAEQIGAQTTPPAEPPMARNSRGRSGWAAPLLAAAAVAAIIAGTALQTNRTTVPAPASPLSTGAPGGVSPTPPAPTTTDTLPASKPAVIPPPPIPTLDLTGLPNCEIGQLVMTYRAGSEGAGNNFGTILVANQAPTACAWTGTLTVTPMTRSDQISTAPTTVDVPAMLMSANSRITGLQVQPAGGHGGWIELMGNARDDPNAPDALCAPQDQIAPAYWRIITAGGTRTVANHDASPPGRYAGVTGCHGQVGITSVDPIPRP